MTQVDQLAQQVVNELEAETGGSQSLSSAMPLTVQAQEGVRTAGTWVWSIEAAPPDE